MKAALALVAAAAAACSVNRKTDQLRCTTSNDCTAPRVCESGYCVVDNGACPGRCNLGCDITTSPPTCRISETGGDNIHCPSDMHCEITCTNPGACGSIDCTDAAACTIDCNSPAACGDIDCGNNSQGQCTITCTGPNACGSITCDQACACDVSCGNGACGTNTCPSAGGNSCTSGSTCSSSPSGCNSCP